MRAVDLVAQICAGRSVETGSDGQKSYILSYRLHAAGAGERRYVACDLRKTADIIGAAAVGVYVFNVAISAASAVVT